MTAQQTTTRDYEADMLAAIKEAIPEWDFVPAVVASELVERLWDNDSDLLTNWLLGRAEKLVAEHIRDLLRGHRLGQRASAKTGAFADAAEKAEAGDETALKAFGVVFEIDAEHTRRYVRDMVGTDHLFVAERYHEASERSRLLSQFHRAVAKKVGARKTADVLSEAAYEEMYRSIVGKAA